MLPGMNESSVATPEPASLPTLSIDELLSDLAASGKSTAAFARDRGVQPWRLYNALRSRAVRKRRATPNSLVPVKVTPTKPQPHATLELKLRSGHSLLIPSNFDEANLRRVMGVLAGC